MQARMRIGFDVSSLCLTSSGVGTYVSSLFDALQATGDDTFVPLAHCGIRAIPILTGPRARLNKTVWMQAVLPILLGRLDMDLCHFTNSVAPAWTPSPSIITIHDMTLWLYPQYHTYRRLAAMRPIIPLAARRANAVIAVSENTKRDIQDILHISPNKIHVIYEAASPHFKPVTDQHEIEATRRDLDLPERFILYVGNVEPRKNIERLVRAMARIEAHRARPISLVIVGSLAWGHEGILKAIEEIGVQDRVRFLGYVDTRSLVALYSMCEVFIYPSLYEGFGLPVLEAMACGAPVITSPNGSLHEIAGDGAAYIDPYSVDDIAETLCELLANPGLRDALRRQGFARTAQFSWDKAARQTLELYRSIEGSH